MNIFDLYGPEFLALYVVLLGGATVFAVIWRQARRGPSDTPDLKTLRLDPFDIAYLSGGQNGLARASAVALVHRGLIELQSGGKLHRIGAKKLPDLASYHLHWCEQAVYGWMEKQWFPRLSTVSNAIDASSIRKRLDNEGLTLDGNSRFTTAAVQASVFLVVLAIGVIKIGVGVSRDRPVGFLIVLCFITIAIMLGTGKPPWRSRRGDVVLDLLRKANKTLQTTAASDTISLAAEDVVMAFSLWGVSMLNGAIFASTRAAMRPASASGWSSSCGSGCGGGGGGCGGGGGGGGCGGGGCGGCGS